MERKMTSNHYHNLDIHPAKSDAIYKCKRADSWTLMNRNTQWCDFISPYFAQPDMTSCEKDIV